MAICVCQPITDSDTCIIGGIYAFTLIDEIAASDHDNTLGIQLDSERLSAQRNLLLGNDVNGDGFDGQKAENFQLCGILAFRISRVVSSGDYGLLGIRRCDRIIIR